MLFKTNNGAGCFLGRVAEPRTRCIWRWNGAMPPLHSPGFGFLNLPQTTFVARRLERISFRCLLRYIACKRDGSAFTYHFFFFPATAAAAYLLVSACIQFSRLKMRHGEVCLCIFNGSFVFFPEQYFLKSTLFCLVGGWWVCCRCVTLELF